MMDKIKQFFLPKHRFIDVAQQLVTDINHKKVFLKTDDFPKQHISHYERIGYAKYERFVIYLFIAFWTLITLGLLIVNLSIHTDQTYLIPSALSQITGQLAPAHIEKFSWTSSIVVSFVSLLLSLFVASEFSLKQKIKRTTRIIRGFE